VYLFIQYPLQQTHSGEIVTSFQKKKNCSVQSVELEYSENKKNHLRWLTGASVVVERGKRYRFGVVRGGGAER